MAISCVPSFAHSHLLDLLAVSDGDLIRPRRVYRRPGAYTMSRRESMLRWSIRGGLILTQAPRLTQDLQGKTIVALPALLEANLFF
jgi:hypothetical protein